MPDGVFRFVASSMSDGCFTLDETFSIRFFNESAEEITGWKRENVLGKKCFEIFQGFTGGKPLCSAGSCPVCKALQNGSSERFSYDLKVPLRDNVMKTLRFKSEIFRDSLTEKPFVTAVFQDCTKAREFEALRQDFMDSMSHEFRTPLSTIKAYTATLRHPKADFGREVRDSFLGIIDAEASKLSGIVDTILDASRISRNRLELHVAIIKIKHFIGEAIENIDISDRHRIYLTGNEASQVFGDAAQLRYVLEHLLKNAVKFSPDGGDIRICVEDGGKDMVIVSIEDEGIGIPFDQQKRVFENFFKIDVGTTKKIYSVGMGLFIVKKIIEAHGGIIWVESVPGRGAKFMFSLPRAHDMPL